MRWCHKSFLYIFVNSNKTDNGRDCITCCF